jgi:hypothetical protein
MSFSISPAVTVSEIDLTTVVPTVATTIGAIAGVFEWGPVEFRVLVASEDDTVLNYGKPTASNFETWFTAASFQAYGDKLYISRAASNTANNAVAYVGGSGVNCQIKNEDDYNASVDSFSANSHFYAKYPGNSYGNSLRICVCDSPNAYSSNIYTDDANNLVTIAFGIGLNTATLTVNSGSSTNTQVNTTANSVLSRLSVGDYLVAGNATVGSQTLKIVTIGAPSVTSNATATATITFENKYFLSDNTSVQSVNTSDSQVQRLWEHYNLVDRAPGTSSYAAARNANGVNTYDELHAVITDAGGAWTGTPGTILEVWPAMSRATDATGEEGGSIWYKNVLNQGSKFVWYAHDRSGATSALASAIAPSSNTIPYAARFTGGTQPDTETAIAISALARAYDKFKSAEDVDVSLIMQGKARGGSSGEQLANYIIDNICEYRKDCVLFVSPDISDVVNNALGIETDVVNFRNALRSTSYAVLDSGYKYAYDRYSDVYRWVPLNGDTAGLVVRTDETRDAWWSPAGFNRGMVKNVIKLAWNPNKSQRDILYKSGVNPVTNFVGEGTVLFGDKTLLAKPSAFDRINVRRLFIVLEKAIATAAKYSLFEFNDEFTRAQFKNLVEPYLRDVQGRRGITDFRVVCDATNNTAEVIDHNQFVADIYIKPARSINFIQLNFVAVRTGVEFEEVIGKF